MAIEALGAVSSATGCVGCPSQLIRPVRADTERSGPYSGAGDSVWDHPFRWGSKRTGPDLARVGGRYSDDWQRAHLYNPRHVVPEHRPVPARPPCGAAQHDHYRYKRSGRGCHRCSQCDSDRKRFRRAASSYRRRNVAVA